LYNQLLTEKARLSAEYEELVNSGATESELQAPAQRLANVNILLANWTNYTKVRSDANSALQNAYSSTNAATSTLNELTSQSNDLAATLNADKDTKKKIVDINTYYSKHYEAYKDLFITVTIVGICVVAALLLSYTPLEFLSRSLTIAICILGGSVVVYKIISMMLRTESNFDEFDWVNEPATDAGFERNKLVDISGINLSKTICVGPLCCGEGTEWNSKQGCVLINPQDITSS
jgi:hypothetical protein